MVAGFEVSTGGRIWGVHRGEADVRVGGAYVYALAREGKIVVTFTGRYLELLIPRFVWCRPRRWRPSPRRVWRP